MRCAAAVTLAGLLLAGCGADAPQSLRSGSDGASEKCTAGWSSYPGPPECDRRTPADTPSASPPTARTSPAARPTNRPSATPAPSADGRSAAPSPTRSTAPVASATAGRGSASPAATARPTPARSSSPSSRPTGQLVITEADSGQTFTISPSTADALLRLGDGWLWSQPEREGSSVELYQRQFIQDPGYSEWEIRPVSNGRTVIRSTGSLACHQAEPPCAAPNRLFEVTIVVR